MRLPNNFIQLSAAQEIKFFELLSLANSLYPLPANNNVWEESIDKSTGLVKKLNLHWFYLTYEYIGKVFFNKRYGALDMLWHRGIERMTQHPIDYIDEFRRETSKGKIPIRWELKKGTKIPMLELSDDRAQMILEMFDYCQKTNPIYSSKNIITFDSNGLFVNTPFHWYQTLFNYLVPAIIYHDKYGCRIHTELDYTQKFGWVGRMTYSLRAEDPVKFIYELYDRRRMNVSLYEKMEDHAYLKEINAREERRVQRDASEKEKEKQRKERESKEKMDEELKQFKEEFAKKK